MKRVLLGICTAGALLLPGLAPTRAVQAAITVVTEQRTIPISWVGLGCTELIAVTGDLHMVTHYTIDPTGSLHYAVSSNAQGVIGMGLTTGTVYHVNEQGHQSLTMGSDSLKREGSVVINSKFVGEGAGGDNLMIHETVHVTTKADGTVTADVLNFSIECTG